MKKLIIISCVLLSAAWAGAALYDFEGLSDPLGTQDNWEAIYGSMNVLTDNGSIAGGTSGTALYKTVDARVWRENDGNWSYSIAATNNQVTLTSHVRISTTTPYSWWGLGYDDGSTIEIGAFYGVHANGVWLIRGADLGTLTTVARGSEVAAGDNVKVRMVMDLNANNGNGSGSLYYMNITDGDEEFTAIAGMQNINLELLNMDGTGASNAENWNGLYARCGGGGMLDNLEVTSSLVSPVLYNCEGLSAPLGTQDNWEAINGSMTVLTGNGAIAGGTSGTAFYNTTDARVWRENDINWTYSIGTWVNEITLTSHVRISATAPYSWWGLGYDDGSTIENGACYGVHANGVWLIRGADLGTLTTVARGSEVAAGDNVKVRMVMDLNANNGNGSGSLYYMNITDGDEEFTAIAGMQNINLELLNMDGTGASNAENWNGLYARCGGGGMLDNLEISTPPPPPPPPQGTLIVIQ